MKIRTFIDRPILAACISALILLLGIIGLANLAMEQYPDIAPPTVQVSTTYTGASAETVQKAVIVPLEEEINGVENMMYMTSSATNTGSGSITVYFKQGTDPDMAAINVQNRVTKAQGTLPSEVTKIGVTAEKRQNSQLQLMSLYSLTDEYDEKFLANYLKINVVPRIQRISGVGEVMVMGNDYAMRIWLKPDVMAQYGLVPSDIVSVLGEQNIESSTGTLGEDSENTFQYTMKYRGRYETSDEFGELVIRTTDNGNVLRLKDVADIELGTTSYNFSGNVSGHPGATFMVMQTAGSNANEIINNINKVADEIRADLPEGLVLETMMSTKSFLDASISNVIETLVEAIILVIIVVYVFLQSVRSTFIPLVGIIVSLVGTFAFLYVAGFSINLLTLFALVLVIGTVVDDSIVVVEAVQAKFDEGYKSPYKATVAAMDGITSAIVTTSLVFMAVFIPVSFMGGTTGTFYTQFGLTMAAAVGISALNALTTCPALCALIMTPHISADDGRKLTFSSRFHIAFDTAFSRLVTRYKTAVKFFFRRKWMVGVALAAACVLLGVLVKTTKTGLIPNEDTGTVFVSITTAPGSTLAETKSVLEEVSARLDSIPQIELYSAVGGYNMMGGGQSSAGGTVIVRLKDWSERKGNENSNEAVIAQIYARTADIKNAQIFAFAPPMIMGYGMTNGLEIYVQDQKGGDIETLFGYTKDFVAALNQRPEIQSAVTTFDTKFPQYLVEVDAARCKQAGVSASDVLDVMSCYVGGNYASNFNRFSKIYRVMVQASPEYRLDTESLNNMFVRTDNGDMAPIGQFVTLTKTYGPEILSRFNLFSTISVNASAADGYSTGDAIEAVREVAKQTLPAGYGYEFGGTSREEASSGTSIALIFVICIIFIYIILCSLYESFFVPMAVMLSVPFGLMGSFLFAKLFGVENNVYMQTGLIMLIGLLSKTAILVTEYASERRRRGMTIAQAALSAAAVRLRPILMTALTMIIGLFPLVVATGAGANGNISLGVGTVGGMLIGTAALLFVVPVLFIVLKTIEEKIAPPRLPEGEEPAKQGSADKVTSSSSPLGRLGGATLLLTLVLTSCGIYTNYQRPETLPTDSLYRDITVNETDTASLADLSWRELFTDAKLVNLIELGLQRNTDLQTARLRTTEAAATLSASKLAFLPSASLTPQGSLSSFDGAKPTKTYSLGASAEWEIDAFGSLRNAKKGSHATYMASRAYEQAVQTQLVATIADTYYSLVASDKKLAITRETVEAWHENVRTMKALKRAGEQDEAAVAQSEASLLEAETSVLALEKQIHELENTLSTLIGIVPQDISRSDLFDLNFSSELATGLPAQLLSRRPDVQQAEWELAEAFYATNKARSSFYPTITLSGSAGWTNSSGAAIVNPGKWLLSAVGSLTQPLFNRGANIANLKIAKAQQEEATLAFSQKLLDAGAEVNNALTQWQTARASLALDQQRIAALQTAVSSTQKLMRHGTTNYLEVLTAQQSLLQSQLTEVSNKYDEIQGVITLYHALGGGTE